MSYNNNIVIIIFDNNIILFVYLFIICILRRVESDERSGRREGGEGMPLEDIVTQWSDSSSQSMIDHDNCKSY